MINFKISQVSPSLTLVKLKGHLDESSRKYFFDCVRGAIFGLTKKNVVIDLSGAVSYTHLTLPTKRIV